MAELRKHPELQGRKYRLVELSDQDSFKKSVSFDEGCIFLFTGDMDLFVEGAATIIETGNKVPSKDIAFGFYFAPTTVVQVLDEEGGEDDKG